MVEVSPMVVVVSIFLIITTFLIVFAFSATSGTQVTQVFSRQECRATMELASKTKIDFLSINSPIPIKCATRYATIKFGDPKKSKDIKTNFPVYYVNNENDLKKVFAEETAECWWQTGEGKVNPFVSSIKQLQPRCIFCTDIVIEKDVVEKGKITQLTNFNQYLRDEKYSRTKKPYSEFFGGNAKFADTIVISMYTGYSIPYSIFFQLIDRTALKKYFVAGALLSPLAAGILYLATDTEMQQAVVIQQFYEVPGYCQQIF